MSKDRKDGKYIKPTDGIHAIFPYLVEKRCDAEVNKTEVLDITKLMKWLEKKNEEVDFKFTFFQAFSTVFIKTVYNRPLLNRFIQGHRLYERNDVSISFVSKNKFSDEAEERMIVLRADPKENAISFAHKMAVDIFNTKSTGDNNLDDILNKLVIIPRFLLRPVVKVIKWLDYHGWVPSALCDNDSNYVTLLLSNLGSIKCNSCYHHLNNYGTNSIVITIGTIVESKGKYTVDISATLDERIADGFYFAKSIKLAQYIIDHPELLEDSLDSKVDFDI